MANALTVVHYEGKYRIAQFQRSMGEPVMEGAALVRFLKRPANLTRLAPDSQNNSRQTSRLLEVRCDFEFEGSSFYQDAASKVLRWINSATDNDLASTKLFDSSEKIFNRDETDWVYVIDFDNGTFETYCGYLDVMPEEEERYYFQDQTEKAHFVKQISTFQLHNLPAATTYATITNGRVEDLHPLNVHKATQQVDKSAAEKWINESEGEWF